MDPNTHSDSSADGLTALATAVEQLAAQDLDGLSDAVRAERVLGLRRLLDRLEGHWLAELANLDARGAAGPRTASRPARPPAGSAPGSAWVLGRPTARFGPPGPCSAAPSPTPPRR